MISSGTRVGRGPLLKTNETKDACVHVGEDDDFITSSLYGEPMHA